MSKQKIEGSVESRVCFEELEDWVREKIQGWVQELLEEEVTELLGRRKSERRRAVDAPSGYRNGYGKPRHLTLSSGTIQVRRPRVRDLEEHFESRVLPLFAKRTRQVRELIPELYLHGLALGDFDLALRGLLGEKAHLSSSTVARLKEKWQAEWEVWQSRPLNDLEVVYLWVDGIYVKAGLEKEKAVLLVVLAALSDGSKAVVSVTSGYRESTQSWSEVLRDLKRRGMGCPRLVIGDGHLGIWGALRNVYPQAEEQRCWNHRIVNLLAKLPKRVHKPALLILRQIPYAQTREEAQRLKKVFQHWCRQRGLTLAAELIEQDWDRMVTFYNYPKKQWQHLRTTNPVESPFAALRGTDAAKRLKVENAEPALMLLVAVRHRSFSFEPGRQNMSMESSNQVPEEKASPDVPGSHAVLTSSARHSLRVHSSRSRDGNHLDADVDLPDAQWLARSGHRPLSAGGPRHCPRRQYREATDHRRAFRGNARAAAFLCLRRRPSLLRTTRGAPGPHGHGPPDGAPAHLPPGSGSVEGMTPAPDLLGAPAEAASIPPVAVLRRGRRGCGLRWRSRCGRSRTPERADFVVSGTR